MPTVEVLQPLQPVRLFERDSQGVLVRAHIKLGKWYYDGPLFESAEAAGGALAEHGKLDGDREYVLLPAVIH